MPRIKYDSDGFAIDNFTNSVEDAAKFEATYNSHRYDDYNDYDEDDDTDYEYDEYEDDYGDKCGCSDPCCPCGGSKWGVP